MLHTLKYLTKSTICPISQGHQGGIYRNTWFYRPSQEFAGFLLAFSSHRKYFKIFHDNLELPLINILILHISVPCSKIQFPH